MKETMPQWQAFNFARQGIKVTHEYFTPDEWLIMHGNVIEFEDGVKIMASDWTEGKDWLLTGWSLY